MAVDLKPHRIQRRRIKGWRWPLCSCGSGHKAIYVGRPSKWENPYKIGAEPYEGDGGQTWEEVLFAYLHLVLPGLDLNPLRGHDLVCWCPLRSKDGKPMPCHADILLGLANGR